MVRGAAWSWPGRLRGSQTLVDGKGICPTSHSGDDEGHGLCHWGPLLMPLGYTGLRKEKGWEEVGILYNGHEREMPGHASTTRNLTVTQMETSPGTGIVLGSCIHPALEKEEGGGMVLSRDHYT